MSKSTRHLLLFMLIVLVNTSVFAAPKLIFTEGKWVQDGDVVIGELDDEDLDFASAYFTENLSEFSLEFDFTLEDIVNHSRWIGVSYRTNEDKTLSHMVRIKQRTALPSGLEVSYLNEERWRYQFRTQGEEFLELGQKYHLQVAVSKDYVFVLLNDELIISTKLASNVKDGSIGLHTNGATVKFENIALSEYPKAEMRAFEEHAEWQFGRQRAEAAQTIPIIVAHRGNSSEAPENTLAAVRSAILAGADAVEIDVYSTIDGELILSHDNTLERCTNGRGDVRYSTSEYLRSLDAGYPDKFGNKFAGEKMPFLREVLEEIKDKVTLVIEIKQPGIEDKILQLLNETGTRDQVVIIAFSAASLARFHDIAPDIPTSVLTYSHKTLDEIIALAKQAKTRSVNLNYGLCNKEIVTALVGKGYSVWAWTVNDPNTMKNMVHNGISVLTTDVPSKALDTFRPLK